MELFIYDMNRILDGYMIDNHTMNRAKEAVELFINSLEVGKDIH